MTFNDQFTKMTNNLLFSNIMFKEGILPKKLKTKTTLFYGIEKGDNCIH